MPDSETIYSDDTVQLTLTACCEDVEEGETVLVTLDVNFGNWFVDYPPTNCEDPGYAEFDPDGDDGEATIEATFQFPGGKECTDTCTVTVLPAP